jgi:hypothetical protein
MRRSNYPLRLQRSLKEEARKAAASEGVSLNQLINVAVAEKVSALRTEIYLHERIRRADHEETLRILDRAVEGNPPTEGDELLSGGLPLAAQGKPFGAQDKQAQPAPPPDRAPDGERTGEIAQPAVIATPRFGMLKRRLEKARRF